MWQFIGAGMASALGQYLSGWSQGKAAEAAAAAQAQQAEASRMESAKQSSMSLAAQMAQAKYAADSATRQKARNRSYLMSALGGMFLSNPPPYIKAPTTSDVVSIAREMRPDAWSYTGGTGSRGSSTSDALLGFSGALLGGLGSGYMNYASTNSKGNAFSSALAKSGR